MNVPPRVRRSLILAGSALLFVSVVILEPQRAADIVIAGIGASGLLVGLYLSRRDEIRTVERAEREEEALAVKPDVVTEDQELPKEEPFDEQI